MTIVAPEREHVAAIERDATVHQPRAHGIWLWSRIALPVDAFRSIVGGLLTLYFVRSTLDVLPLLRAGFFDWALAESPLSSFYPFVLSGRAILAVAIAFGVAPRLCAALLLLCGATLSVRLGELIHLDDWTANIACFWLALFPVGHSLRLSRLWKTNAAIPTVARVPGLVVALFLTHVLTFYVNVPLWTKLSPLWAPTPLVPLAACAIPALYVLPSVSARRLAALLQIGLHSYLLFVAGEPLTHGTLLASALLFWGERAPQGRPLPAPPKIELRGALAASYTSLLALWLISSGLKAAELNQLTSHVLRDVGLHVPSASARVADESLQFIGTDGRVRDWRNVRGLPSAELLSTRLLIARILVSATASSAQERELARTELSNVARLYCINRVPSERRVTIKTTSGSLRDQHARSIATFHCYEPTRSLEMPLSTSRPHEKE